MEFQLCPEDRALFGCGEWLPCDIRAISVADLEELSERFAFDPEDWPEPFSGQLTLEQAGDPDAKPKPPRWRNRALIWMILRQNGCDVSWEDVGKARAYLIQARHDEVPELAPGKEPTEETPSPPSESSTTRRSKSSTGTSRSK